MDNVKNCIVLITCNIFTYLLARVKKKKSLKVSPMFTVVCHCRLNKPLSCHKSLLLVMVQIFDFLVQSKLLSYFFK